MITPRTLLASIGLLASAVWLGHLAMWLRHRGRLRRLVDQPADAPLGGWPRLAVLFAARDEAPHVLRAARSMLSQDYPGLEVVAVDDRSADGTGPILDRLAAECPALTVVHVRELPDGWLGKTHALQVASESTDADWLLLTDADVVLAPAALRRAVGYAARSGADHLTVTPQIPTEHVGERLFLAMFDAVFALGFPIWRVESGRSRAHLGIGAFNLVRAEVFRDVGGFRRLALSVDDDMRLGEALKAAGYRTRVLLGDDAVVVRWQVGLGGMVRGLEKNFFPAVRFRIPNAVAAGALLLGIGAGPLAGLIVGPWWVRATCATGIAASCAVIGVYGRKHGVRWYYGLTLPVGAVLLVYALARSAWVTLTRGGVRWRDHFYPIGPLRRHLRLRDAWLRELWRSTR